MQQGQSRPRRSGSRYPEKRDDTVYGKRLSRNGGSAQDERTFRENRYARPSQDNRTTRESRYARPSQDNRISWESRYARPSQDNRTTRESRYVRPSQDGRMSRRKKKKHGSPQGRGVLLLLLAVVLVAACGGGLFYFLSRQKVPKVSVDLTILDSPYAVLVDGPTGQVLASKGGGDRIYPASMTKILTVYTAIRHLDNLDQTVTLSYDYFDSLYENDASRAGFEPGEEASIRDLLYGAMLPSGAECCMELSIQAAGSQEGMVELMNQEAERLGLSDSHFSNVTGLHDENLYSTPEDIAKLLRAALENDTFYEIFTTHSYTVAPSAVHPEGFTFWSTMFKNMTEETVNGGEILGGKTGYTQEAGHCLASMARVNDRSYVLVTAGAAENPSTELYHINDAFLAYNQIAGEE
ncbi:MAG TPA: D-alanyl-D-alanine carboxypeptidase [Candidatus Choladousia intestinigallinarum]|nr:D-alanyl-D-alanine carboxypeptidase [Candidatus Choladousia intestinigallinarum]